MAKLLIADDDQTFMLTLSEWLKGEHYLLDVVYDGDAALEYLQTFDYDAIVLDWNMPGATGVEVCQRYRAAGGMQPLIILTGKNSPQDAEIGLDSGADDYITKPVDFRELSARLRALMRRPAQVVSEVITVRDITVDMRTRKVSKANKELNLQTVEYNVLVFLMKNQRQDFSVETLLQRIWGSESDVSHHAIYSCIKRVRRKLEQSTDKPLIISTYGVGYRLEP